VTLAELIDLYIKALKTQKGYSEHTVRNYRSDLEQFLGFLREKGAREGKTEQEPAVESIDFLTIREYFSNLFSAARRTTVARKVSAVKSFFFLSGEKRADPQQCCSRPDGAQAGEIHPHVSSSGRDVQAPAEAGSGATFGFERSGDSGGSLLLRTAGKRTGGAGHQEH
jgi:hypothetical protein